MELKQQSSKPERLQQKRKEHLKAKISQITQFFKQETCTTQPENLQQKRKDHHKAKIHIFQPFPHESTTPQAEEGLRCLFGDIGCLIKILKWALIFLTFKTILLSIYFECLKLAEY